jgi:DNA-directed RNA polymerase specialized sigma24 family protein
MKTEKIELFNKYILPETRFIYRLCFKYSKSKNECHEYYSEVMFRIFIGIETYNSQFRIRPWLYVITRRTINELCLKRVKLNEVIDVVDITELSNYPMEIEEACSNYFGVDNYQKYYSDDILQALNLINSTSRNAILLQQSGYKLKEIADELYNTKQIRKNSIESVKYYLRMGKT